MHLLVCLSIPVLWCNCSARVHAVSQLFEATVLAAKNTDRAYSFVAQLVLRLNKVALKYTYDQARKRLKDSYQMTTESKRAC